MIIGIILISIIVGVLFYYNSADVKYGKQMALGNKYANEMKYKDAADAYMAAIAIDPQKSDAYIELEKANFEVGDYEKSIAILKKLYEDNMAYDVFNYTDKCKDLLEKNFYEMMKKAYDAGDYQEVVNLEKRAFNEHGWNSEIADLKYDAEDRIEYLEFISEIEDKYGIEKIETVSSGDVFGWPLYTITSSQFDDYEEDDLIEILETATHISSFRLKIKTSQGIYRCELAYEEGKSYSSDPYDVYKNEEKIGSFGGEAGKRPAKSGTNSSGCPMCNGTGHIKYYYGNSDLEAVLTGHDPYQTGVCPSCNGTGK